MPVQPSIRDSEFEAVRDELFAALMDGNDNISIDTLRSSNPKGLLPRFFRLFQSFTGASTAYFGRIPGGCLYGMPKSSIEIGSTEHPDGSVSIDISASYRYSYFLIDPTKPQQDKKSVRKTPRRNSKLEGLDGKRSFPRQTKTEVDTAKESSVS